MNWYGMGSRHHSAINNQLYRNQTDSILGFGYDPNVVRPIFIDALHFMYADTAFRMVLQNVELLLKLILITPVVIALAIGKIFSPSLRIHKFRKDFCVYFGILIP